MLCVSWGCVSACYVACDNVQETLLNLGHAVCHLTDIRGGVGWGGGVVMKGACLLMWRVTMCGRPY